jgi:excisionase family DNA binding protein
MRITCVMQPNQNSEVRGGFKLKHAARYLDVSPMTIKRLIERGMLRPNKKLRHLLFSRAELDRFLNTP